MDPAGGQHVDTLWSISPGAPPLSYGSVWRLRPAGPNHRPWVTELSLQPLALQGGGEGWGLTVPTLGVH